MVFNLKKAQQMRKTSGGSQNHYNLPYDNKSENEKESVYEEVHPVLERFGRVQVRQFSEYQYPKKYQNEKNFQ
jgi:hypothetical protein